MREKYLVFGRPRLEREEKEEMRAALDSAWIGTGPRVAKFEQAFRDYIGAEHAIAVNSCTAALHLSMVAAGVGPGDEVLTTPMTFCATINAIIHTGATPVLVDVDPQTMILNPDNLEASLSEKTKAILPVHFAGRPADVDALQAIAARHGLLLIEDAAMRSKHASAGAKLAPSATSRASVSTPRKTSPPAKAAW